MEEYMMASKSVGVIPLALSLVTSFMSGLSILPPILPDHMMAHFSLARKSFMIGQNIFQR